MQVPFTNCRECGDCGDCRAADVRPRLKRENKKRGWKALGEGPVVIHSKVAESKRDQASRQVLGLQRPLAALPRTFAVVFVSSSLCTCLLRVEMHMLLCPDRLRGVQPADCHRQSTS